MRSPLYRTVALVLCCQPVFWMSNVALAQTVQRGASGRQDSEAPFAPPRSTETSGTGFDLQPGTQLEARTEPRSDRPAAVPVQPPVDQPVDPETYVVGPGDVIELNFWGLQNFKVPVTVDLEGRAFIPKIGYLPLKGKTLSQVRQVLRGAVGRYYPQLGFDLSLAQPRTFLVQAVGDVARPGSHPARAVDRVATFLARAGGLGPHASRRRIEVRRKDGAVLPVDLELFGLTGDVAHNPFLLDGDVVHVPFESLTAQVDGAVNRPGRYELTGSRDLAELVMLGGGLAPAATRRMPVTVVRRDVGDAQNLSLVPFAEGDQLPAFVLKQDDAIRFPSFDELQRSVMVIGALAGVATPEEAASTKRLAFVDGDSVRTLLERVGGVGPLADLGGSYLLRGTESIPVDLYALLMLKDLKADRPVQLGDSLVVPFKRRSILVEGAVFAPGAYPYNPSFGVEQYLSLAGGRNRFALDLDEVRIISSSGETRPFARDLRVDPGSALVVPERNFSRAEVVTILIAAAGILISGATLYLTYKKY